MEILNPSSSTNLKQKKHKENRNEKLIRKLRKASEKEEVLKAARRKKYTLIENDKDQNNSRLLDRNRTGQKRMEQYIKVLRQQTVKLGFCTQQKYL